jgi:hypothetical protein
MRRLATWSNRRVQALWLAWFGLVGCLVMVKLWRQWQRQAPAPVSAVLPEQHTDYVYSVVFDDVALLKTALLLLGPPAILTALWLYLRHGSHRGPPT